MSTTFEDPNEKSINACYAILPFPEAMAIWDKWPLPSPDNDQYRSRTEDDDSDDPDIYIA